MSFGLLLDRSLKRWCLALAVGAFLALAAAPASGDEPLTLKADRAWSVELALGASFGGPADDIEHAMEAAGFDDNVGGGDGWGTTDYPFTSSDTESARISARRRLGHGRWSVGVGVGWTSFGQVFGNQIVEGEPPSYHSIESEIDMATVTPMAWFHALPGARLGVGLGLNRVNASLGRRYSGSFEESTSWKPGLMLEAAVTIPSASRFYLLLLLQYEWMQDGTVGPWQELSPTGEPVIFPETDVPLSHGCIGVGLGIRF